MPKIGIAHEMKDENDYAAAIRSLLELPSEEYNAMCKRAQETAKIYDYESLTKQMVQVIKKIEDQ